MNISITIIVVAIFVAIGFAAYYLSLSKRPCPHCRAMMSKKSETCPHCGRKSSLSY